MIPRKIKIGRVPYTVQQPYKVARGTCNGQVYLDHKIIEVARAGRTLPARTGTFWHEVTHAILYEMGHALYKDEKFVTAFSKRLNTVVQNAEF